MTDQARTAGGPRPREGRIGRFWAELWAHRTRGSTQNPTRPPVRGDEAARDTAGGRRWWLSWAAIAVVLVVGLAIGTGLGSGTAPATPAQRVAKLEHLIGCPSCADLSVAQSNATTAVAIRQLIGQQVAAGASDKAIENQVVASYGGSILLAPPTSGVGGLVWALPALALALALAGLVVTFRRRRRPHGSDPLVASDEDRALVDQALGR